MLVVSLFSLKINRMHLTTKGRSITCLTRSVIGCCNQTGHGTRGTDCKSRLGKNIPHFIIALARKAIFFGWARRIFLIQFTEFHSLSPKVLVQRRVREIFTLVGTRLFANSRCTRPMTHKNHNHACKVSTHAKQPPNMHAIGCYPWMPNC